jgi:hypothetical protein
MALVRTDVSEEPSASFIGVRRIGKLGTKLAVTRNQRTLRRNITCYMRRLLVTPNVFRTLPIIVTLMMEALVSSETSVLIRFTGRNMSEDGILHDVETFTEVLEALVSTRW